MFRIVATLVLVVFAGCATAQKTEEPRAAAPRSEGASLAVRNQGYALFYKLMSDEKNLSKLLLIKKEQADLGELIKRISKVSGELAEGLEKFRKADGHLHLELDGLPTVEKEVRDSIGKTRAKELVTKSGQKFELRVLLTQSEALTYGAHLAAVLQKHESDEERRKFLAEASQRLQDLHQGVIDLMHTRWDRPASR